MFESCSFSQHSQGSGMMPFLMPMPIPPVRFLAGMKMNALSFDTQKLYLLVGPVASCEVVCNVCPVPLVQYPAGGEADPAGAEGGGEGGSDSERGSSADSGQGAGGAGAAAEGAGAPCHDGP